MRVITVKKAEIVLAKAKPTWAYPNLKARSQANKAFKIIDANATYIGFFGCCLAKKLGVSILISMKANNPKANAIKLEEVLLESIELNSPLSNNVKMIGSANITKPITAGTPIKKINLMDQSKVDENCTLFSLANRLDNLGKITVAIAIAKIPKGSCINRSET